MTTSGLSNRTAADPLHITEKAFQAQVIEAARWHGWAVYFTQNSRRSPYGEPDLRLVKPPRYVLMELKTDKGRMSQHQLDTAALLRRCPGVEYYGPLKPSDWDLIAGVLAGGLS